MELASTLPRPTSTALMMTKKVSVLRTSIAIIKRLLGLNGPMIPEPRNTILFVIKDI